MAGKIFKSFDNSKIYYEISPKKGKDDWLVFLHGFGGNLTAWKKERAYFENLGIPTIALDLRGHGFSQRGNSQAFYNFENFAKDVVGVLKKERIKKTSLIGHCFGGLVSMYTYALSPKSTSNLVLVDTSYKPPFIGDSQIERSLFKSIFSLLSKVLPDVRVNEHADFDKFIGTGDLNIRRIFSDMVHTSLKSYFLLAETIVGLDAKHLLEKIDIPTLVIEGSKDTIFPPDIAKSLNKRIKQSELEMIEGANHILVINNPEDLNKTILSFLRKMNFPLEKRSSRA